MKTNKKISDKQMITKFKQYALKDIEKLISKKCNYVKMSVGYTRNEIKNISDGLFYYSEHYPTSYKENFICKVKHYFHRHITKKGFGWHEAFAVYLDGCGEIYYYDARKLVKAYSFGDFIEKEGYQEFVDNEYKTFWKKSEKKP